MVEARSRVTKGRLRTKTLSWRPADEAVLRTLRAQVAAKLGVVWTERDLVAAALRVALMNPAALTRPRAVADV